MPDLLIELFSEEIPARMQSKAADDLRARLTEALVEAGLTYAGAAAFSTPRRLALTVQGLSGQSPTTREERKGPRVDAPEQAIEGFLRGAGLTRDDLEIRDEKKGQVYFATITKPGRAAAEIVAEELDKIIRNFPWPKSMRWGAGSLRWVRPLHSILCILTDEAGEVTVVDFDVDGIRAGNTTEGHRFMAAGRFAVSSFDDYRTKLRRAHVILEAEERAAHIWQEASNQAFASGLELVEDPSLLAEVAGLVEWPVVLMGRIDDAFLGLPPEVLQTSMREHQKFFSVKNPKTGRIERFVTVANVETADQGVTILAGNQKVLAARLSDAKFFWENDLRTVQAEGLEGMGAGLAHVTFHNKLGSQADRIARIAALAREIAPHVGADADLAEQAARVAKADLQSAMVGEFPELQGLMGRYYAAEVGLAPEVAAACQEHYSPLGPGDAVPSAPVSVAVALADKIDTLTGFWAIDEKPTGSKDPYALRRAALGVIRLVLGNGLRLRLSTVLENKLHSIILALRPKDFVVAVARFHQVQHVLAQLESSLESSLSDSREHLEKALQAARADFAVAEAEYRPKVEIENRETTSKFTDLLSFLHDRLKVHLRDEGIRHDVIDACLAMPGNDDLTLLVHRARALSDFLKTDDGENLLQGFKRANNILTQAEEKDGVEYSYGADVKFAETDEEKALFAALATAEPAIANALKAEDFARAMGAMAALRAPIDAFFNAVQVNAESQVIRRNRLNLLSSIRNICLQAADLGRIEG
ncbi:Glycine--tRNA ligase beta subunit [Roseovarius sp. EC-HK134]|uniref:glycine--tRNA ligase subunit beta n=1 Tax=unclassified Roseovarius TaxID=2614913 RepID=UPI001257AC98|nr:MULTISPECIES: glycine--tRNA ligase subunit beta [unclassified Roseovarius]VVT33705.1 Glycine--tRNA ligase beta subunit [Roseovarius sp. EC-SD190]VVT33707.1 Glycine--tRNA ligase beta subunit [Roseovarius sp. EC-HK134]